MFKKARLKLTFRYLILIMAISVSFSIVIYKVDINEVERFDRIQRTRIERRLTFPGAQFDPQLIQETEKRIVINLIIINFAIACFSGTGGYFLAGITLKPIKEMVDEQNRFISDAAHIIGTPLTSLKTAMEVYLRDKKPNLDEAKVLVKESITEVDKLQVLSGSLLQLAQYEKPENHIKLEIVSLEDLIKIAVPKINPLAKQKNITIETKIKNYKIKANKYAMIDLFVILLDNAVKYSPKNSKVNIVTKKSDEFINISVTDHGIGIDKKDIPHIFDRFFKGSNTAKGYGLGLSIAKKIVDTHHGYISIESELNKGSAFTICLPISYRYD